MPKASWAMAQENATTWLSEVGCVHGFTRVSVWVASLADDREFLACAPVTFANHQRLHPACNCTLELDWTPTYQAPAPEEPDPLPDAPAALPEGTVALVAAVYGTYPYLWGVRNYCPHGWTLSGNYTAGTAPDLPAAMAANTENHRRLFPCSDPLAPPPSHVALTHNTLSVPSGGTGTLVQNVPTSISGVFNMTGTLSVTAAALVNVQVSMKLASLSPNVGNALLLIAGQVVARAPFTLPAGATNVKASINWSGYLGAGQTIQAGYQNTSPYTQSVNVGSNLAADEAPTA